MEIRVLCYFLTVAKVGGINKAAQILHITQPTLSRQLMDLEEELHVTLFDRSGKNIYLTSEGLLLKRRAEEILSLVDTTEKELMNQEDLMDGKIVIGGGELATMQILADIIKDFHKQFPRVTFDIITGNADTIKEQVENGLIDIGVLLEPVVLDPFDFIRLKQKEKWVVLMQKEDSLAKKDYITAADLKNAPLILPMRSNIKNELSHYFCGSLQDSQILATSNLTTNGANLVERGLAYSIVIEGSISFYNSDTIVSRPLFPNLASNSVIVWKKGQPHNKITEKFLHSIQCFLGIDSISN